MAVNADVGGVAAATALSRAAGWTRPSTVRLYFWLVLAGLRAKLEYRADFLIMALGAMLMQAMGYTFLYVLFRQIPTVAGWSFWELVVVYALIFITEGFVSLFFDGLWGFNHVLHRGEFDAMLVRPVSPILQVVVRDLGINGLGNIALGAVMIAQALVHLPLEWTLLKVAGALILFASAVAVRGATVLASSALGFWTNAPQNTVMHVVHNLSSFAQFPLSIYGRGLQVLLTFGIPFAFVSYYPAAWIFGKQQIAWIGLLTPLVAVYTLCAARWLFQRGIRRYESTGS